MYDVAFSRILLNYLARIEIKDLEGIVEFKKQRQHLFDIAGSNRTDALNVLMTEMLPLTQAMVDRMSRNDRINIQRVIEVGWDPSWPS